MAHGARCYVADKLLPRVIMRSRSSPLVPLIALLVCCAPSCTSEQAPPTEPPPTGTVPVGLEAVASGLDFPLYLTAPSGDARLFIAEKGGRIRVVKNGVLLPTPFLDLSARVSTGGEQGLLGLAFDP